MVVSLIRKRLKTEGILVDGVTIAPPRKEVTLAPPWGSCSPETEEAASEALHDKDKPWLCKDPKYAADVEV